MKNSKNRGLPSNTMTIGQLARRAGVSPRIIRYYEQVGLFPLLPRAANGYRIYADKDLYGLRLFRRAKRLGFSFDEIKELIEIQEKNPSSEKKIIKRSLEFLEAHLKSAKKKKKELDDHISLLDFEIKRVTGLL